MSLYIRVCSPGNVVSLPISQTYIAIEKKTIAHEYKMYIQMYCTDTAILRAKLFESDLSTRSICYHLIMAVDFDVHKYSLLVCILTSDFNPNQSLQS